jgi:glycosyltransferase involved in cell wall biosynthesis
MRSFAPKVNAGTSIRASIHCKQLRMHVPALGDIEMKTAVIISTYNSPIALEKVLWGYTAQTFRQFELIIADDGSGAPTRRVIEQFQGEGMPINHVWHPDRGFRKCTILNRAIASTDAEYLIFSDGDCIPRNDFVSTHVALREPGRFLSGGTVYLPSHLTQRIDIRDVMAGRATDLPWLRENGLGQAFRGRTRLGRHPRLQGLWDRLTLTQPTLNGHNTSAWRSDIIAANGFDERMGYGGLDRELGERLENADVRGKQVRHRAVCVHLFHKRGYESDRMWQHNYAIRRETREQRRTFTSYGISQLPVILPFAVPNIEAQPAEELREVRKAA